MKLGYEKHKGLDKYIIHPDEKYSREVIKDCLSRSFGHYLGYVETGRRGLSFKCLRKTWFTSCAGAVGREMLAAMIT